MNPTQTTEKTASFTIKRTQECSKNPVMANGVEIGQVEWSGCFYTKRAGREVRSQGYWFIVGDASGRRFRTLKAAAAQLFSELA